MDITVLRVNTTFAADYALQGCPYVRSRTDKCDPADLWHYCIHLVLREEVFKKLMGALASRPIVHR